MEEKPKPTSDEIQKIVKENDLIIPAGILYTFLQFTEIGSQRGAFRANELSIIGGVYDTGTKILNSLIDEKYVPSSTKVKKVRKVKKKTVDENQFKEQ